MHLTADVLRVHGRAGRRGGRRRRRDAHRSLLRRRVIAHGLVARADLNQKSGVVTAWDGAKGRYTVFFDAINQPLAIKPGNLTDVGPAVPRIAAAANQ